jgi:hypothetical protein
MFMLQNKAAISLLRDTQGMASIKETLAAKVPGLKRENIAHARAWLDICPPGWERYEGENWWPVYFSVSYSDSSKSKFDVALILDKGYANSDEEGEELREHLKIFDARFVKHQSTDRRRVVLDKNLSVSDLVQKLDGHSTRLLKATA